MKKAKNKPETQALRVLILEDNPADAELVKRELKRSGIAVHSHVVDGKREFKKALTEAHPQVILSDFKLPRFDGLAALKMASSLTPDTPFLFVSGSIGEEQAIETLTLGASDYIFKDNLQRLVPAVRRAIEEARLKSEKTKSDEELRRRIGELKLLAEAAEHFVQINTLDELYKYLSPLIQDISKADYLLLSIYDKDLQAVRPKTITGFEPFQETLRRRFHFDPLEMVFYLKDMRADDFSDFVSRKLLPVRDGLYGLTNRKLPRPVCRAIEKLLGMDSMFSMGFSWENQLFGGLTLSFKKGNELKNRPQIEALLNQAAVAIKRLLAERDLRENEKKYRTLVTQSPDGIFIVDLQGGFLSVNQAICAGLNYSESELLSMKIWDIVPGEYRQQHERRLADIIQGRGKNEAVEYMVKTKDGEPRHISILSAPFFQDDKLIGFQGIARDITEKKKMEIRLRESEEYYRTLVETSPDAIIIVDAGGRVTFASPKTSEVFGIPNQNILTGLSIADFVEPGEIPRVQARMVEILSGHSLPQINEYRLLKHDRRPFWGEISSSPLRDAAGRNIGLLLICRDVSDRRRSEARLRDSEEKYRLIADNTAETITVLDMDLKFIYVSPSIFKLRGYTVEEALDLTLQQSMPPGSLEKIRLVLSEEMALEAGGGANPKRSRTLELQEYHKDGFLIWIENSISFLRDPQGKAIGFLAVSKDISERKQAELALRRSENLLNKIIDTLPVGLWLADEKGKLVRSNVVGRQIWGAEPLVGQEEYGQFKARRLPEGKEIAPDDWALAHTINEKSTITDEMLEITAFDGTKKIILNYSAPVLDEAGNIQAAVVVNLDISDRQQAEQQVRASLKEKEVLLQEIHHRVKNNLQIISGLLTLQADQSAGKSLTEIFQASQDRIRSIALIHEKLYRSHNLAEIEFDEYLRSLIENLFSTHGVAAGRISIDYKMEKILFTIEKAIPLGLIVNELITNILKHAFPDGRRGEIRIGLHPHANAKSHARKTESGRLFRVPACELVIADNGVGLPSPRMPEQQKTLGMKLVTMLAQQLQAELKVKTGPGTEFRFIFPGLPTNESIKDQDHGS